MCVQNLKFLALPLPEIIGGTLKLWTDPGYAANCVLFVSSPKAGLNAVPNFPLSK